MYMGADQDAVEVGAPLGVARDHSVTYGRGQERARDGVGLRQDRQPARGPDLRPGRTHGGLHRRGAGLAGGVRYFGGIRMPPSTRITSAFM